MKENGSGVSARLLSDGTLRMLGLLSLTGAVDAPTLVGFEEPENGVHPGRIDLIAGFLNTRRMTGQTQFIVTTHSPILPDLLPSDSLLIAGRQGGHTRIEPFAAWGPAGRRRHIDEALRNNRPATEEEPLPISRRLLRGDFRCVRLRCSARTERIDWLSARCFGGWPRNTWSKSLWFGVRRMGATVG